jgi:hypothetical protein
MMKKMLAIWFAVLIFLSGMNLTIATHFCGGEVYSIKWSFTGKKATCGMEDDELSSYSSGKQIFSGCCSNDIKAYAVDGSYSPAFFQIQKITRYLLQVFDIPVHCLFLITNSLHIHTDVSPPGYMPASAVALSYICVFRI